MKFYTTAVLWAYFFFVPQIGASAIVVLSGDWQGAVLPCPG